MASKNSKPVAPPPAEFVRVDTREIPKDALNSLRRRARIAGFGGTDSDVVRFAVVELARRMAHEA